MRTLLFLALAALGLYWYAERYGLAVGYPLPPVFYWKYTGEAEYRPGHGPLRRLEGEGLGEAGGGEAQGRPVAGRPQGGRADLRRRLPGRGALRREPRAYLLRFELQGAKGQVRYDWVTTKFAP